MEGDGGRNLGVIPRAIVDIFETIERGLPQQAEAGGGDAAAGGGLPGGGRYTKAELHEVLYARLAGEFVNQQEPTK